jgi:hypothetical protein
MSRGGGDDFDENFPNEGAFWERRARQVMTSKRGRKALADLREALMALPEHRLVSRALCTVGQTHESSSDWRRGYVDQLLAEQGEGVCAVGAYMWHQKVKGGMDPDEAMRSLPMLDDDAYTIEDTAREGEAAGLTYTLAWLLADRNDEMWHNATPGERWQRFIGWIDTELAKP